MDVRRQVPRTDAVLADPAVEAAARRLGRRQIKQAVAAAQQRVREGTLAPTDIVADVLAALPDTATTLRPVLNATGVLLHTNLGRAPLSTAALDALAAAAGTTDVELDLATGGRGRRGAGALAALAEAVPAAAAVHVVNNGAAALGVPVVADIGSGLLAPQPELPEEPDAPTTLAQGADLVTASGDKLLGGPQAGLLLRSAELVTALRRHPLARALRVDKLTLAALEATLRGPETPTAQALAADPAELHRRATAIATALAAHGIDAAAVASQATAGG